MKRIDSVNARDDVNGAGKKGFHDNADLEGQDATYLTPDFLNFIQEEICSIIEKNGHLLDADSKQQLFDILATDESVIALADAIESRLLQLQQQMTTADNGLQQQITSANNNLQQQISSTLETLQQQISNLTTNLASIYPKLRMAGVLGNNGGDGWYTVNKPTGSNINFLDMRFAILASREAKAFDANLIVNREADKFHVYIDVSDANAGIYNTRRINYSVIETEGVSSTSGNGDYAYTGNEVAFQILPGESKAFLLIGAGAGAGSSRYEDLASNSNPAQLSGSNGEATYIAIDGTNTVFTAGGGTAGSGGIDSGTGQYINGTAGTGGLWMIAGEYVSATRTNGQAGNATAANHSGAKTDADGRGAGGDGADGYLVAEQGFGAGGGEGARISAIYTNNTDSAQYCRIYVGKAGLGERSLNTYNEAGELVEAAENYLVGADGTNGFIRVLSAT